MNTTPLSRLKSWIPVGVAVTLLSVMVYGAIQQNIRQSANDPQVQIADDAATKLASGTPSENIVTGSKVELNNSLAPFVIVFDDNGKVLSSTATLEGKTPVPPIGVLTTAREHGENRITWQPAAKVRSAIVVRYFNDKATGYVLVGRSLQETEKRISSISLEIFLGWVLTMLVTLFAAMILNRHAQPHISNIKQ